MNHVPTRFKLSTSLFFLVVKLINIILVSVPEALSYTLIVTSVTILLEITVTVFTDNTL